MSALPQIGRAACVNPEAEYALLGHLMMNGASLRSLGVELRPEHFSEAVCQRLCAVIIDRVSRGENTGHPSVLPYMATDGQDNSGMARWLASVATRACNGMEAASYARHVVDLAQRRQMGALFAEGGARALNPDPATTAQSIIEDVESKLRALADEGCNSDARLKQIGRAAGEVVSRVESIMRDGKRPGISTGLTDLDDMLGGGLFGSALYLIAGRPSMGKTALGIRVARNVALQGVPVGLFSLEMGDDEIATRLLGAEAGLPYQDIRSARGFRSSEIDAIVAAKRALDAIPLHVSDKAAITVAALRSEVLRLSAREPLGAIVIDYMQLMTAADRYQGNKVQQVSEISAGLKALAKDLRVPVIALSQLSREVEKRNDKRPMLSDLRDSGAIEQDADVVMFVYREEYYLEREKADNSLEYMRRMDAAKNRCDVLVQKNRHGAVGDVPLYCDIATGVFGNWSDR